MFVRPLPWTLSAPTRPHARRWAWVGQRFRSVCATRRASPGYYKAGRTRHEMSLEDAALPKDPLVSLDGPWFTLDALRDVLVGQPFGNELADYLQTAFPRLRSEERSWRRPAVSVSGHSRRRPLGRLSPHANRRQGSVCRSSSTQPIGRAEGGVSREGALRGSALAVAGQHRPGPPAGELHEVAFLPAAGEIHMGERVAE
jgi:hypothetical protein